MRARRCFVVISAIVVLSTILALIPVTLTGAQEPYPSPATDPYPLPIEPTPSPSPTNTPPAKIQFDYSNPVVCPTEGNYFYYGDYSNVEGSFEDRHTGVDCPNKNGTVVSAAGDGVVILVEQGWMTFTGWSVFINHGADPETGLPFNTFYTHMLSASVDPGQVVKKGDPIGEVGKGHLHWGATNQDPSEFSGYYEHAKEQTDGKGWIDPQLPPTTIVPPGQVFVTDEHAERVLEVKTIADLGFIEDMRTEHVLSTNTEGVHDLNRVEGIIWHQTATGPIDSKDREIDGVILTSIEAGRGDSRPGYHVVCGLDEVTVDGETFAKCQWLVDTGTQAWHGLEYNNSHLAVSFVDAKKGGPPSPAQLRSLMAITAVWMQQFGLDESTVQGHKEVHPGRRGDPVGVDMGDMRKRLGEMSVALIPHAKSQEASASGQTSLEGEITYEKLAALMLDTDVSTTWIVEKRTPVEEMLAVIGFWGNFALLLIYLIVSALVIWFYQSKPGSGVKPTGVVGLLFAIGRFIRTLTVGATPQKAALDGSLLLFRTVMIPDRARWWMMRPVRWLALTLITMIGFIYISLLAVYTPILPRPEAIVVYAEGSSYSRVSYPNPIQERPEAFLEKPGVVVYSEGKNYLAEVRLDQGAAVVLLHGDQQNDLASRGLYDGPYSRFSMESVEKYSKILQTEYEDRVVCVANGTFYAPGWPAKGLTLPLKVDGEILTSGWVKEGNPEQRLMLELWSDHADIKRLSAQELYNSTAPNILGGLTVLGQKDKDNSLPRTFVGIDDRDGDGKFETVLVAVFGSGRTQADADAELKSWGADATMMLDGGQSSQLTCDDKSLVSSRHGRKPPQAIGIVAAEEVISTPTPTPTPTPLPEESEKQAVESPTPTPDVWQKVCNEAGFQNCQLLQTFYIQGMVPRGRNGMPIAEANATDGKIFPWWVAAGIPAGETNTAEWQNVNPLEKGPWGKYLGYTEYANYEEDLVKLDACKKGLEALAANAFVRVTWPDITAEKIRTSAGCAVGRGQTWAGHFRPGGILGSLKNKDVWTDNAVSVEAVFVHLVTRYSSVCGADAPWYDTGNVEQARCAYNPNSWGVPEHQWYWDAIRTKADRILTAWEANGKPQISNTTPDRSEALTMPNGVLNEGATEKVTSPSVTIPQDGQVTVVVRPTEGSGPFAIWETLPSLTLRFVRSLPDHQVTDRLEEALIWFGQWSYSPESAKMLGFYSIEEP